MMMRARFLHNQPVSARWWPGLAKRPVAPLPFLVEARAFVGPLVPLPGPLPCFFWLALFNGVGFDCLELGDPS
jgi:hypothetical protein